MVIPKDMTIYTAAELKPGILAAVRGTHSPLLDLASVTEIDSAGLQLLYLAQREAQVGGTRLRLAGCSPAVLEVLELVGFPSAGREAA